VCNIGEFVHTSFTVFRRIPARASARPCLYRCPCPSSCLCPCFCPCPCPFSVRVPVRAPVRVLARAPVPVRIPVDYSVHVSVSVCVHVRVRVLSRPVSNGTPLEVTTWRKIDKIRKISKPRKGLFFTRDQLNKKCKYFICIHRSDFFKIKLFSCTMDVENKILTAHPHVNSIGTVYA
jgi:hypothetical protein